MKPSVQLLGPALGLACLCACSGEAFHFSEVEANEPQAQAQDFPPFVPTTRGSREAGAPAPGPLQALLDAGSNELRAPDAEPPPPPGACGALRAPSPELADAEACIPAGSFEMGDGSGNVPAGYTAHAPVRSVLLSPYVIDAYEVSVARYRACVSAGACSAPSTSQGQGCTYTAQAGERELHPITCVSWQSAAAFCAWDGDRRLPTEAEWERAARGSSSNDFPWGDTFDCTRAVLGGAAQCPQHQSQTPRAVGSTPSGQSAEGVFDLAGNAWEWVADWAGPYTGASTEDPTGPASGSARIQRGGGWQTIATDATGYVRRAEAPAALSGSSFRCARSAP